MKPLSVKGFICLMSAWCKRVFVSTGALPLKPHLLFLSWNRKSRQKEFKTAPALHKKLRKKGINRPNLFPQRLENSNKGDCISPSFLFFGSPDEVGVKWDANYILFYCIRDVIGKWEWWFCEPWGMNVIGGGWFEINRIYCRQACLGLEDGSLVLGKTFWGFWVLKWLKNECRRVI